MVLMVFWRNPDRLFHNIRFLMNEFIIYGRVVNYTHYCKLQSQQIHGL